MNAVLLPVLRRPPLQDASTPVATRVAAQRAAARRALRAAATQRGALLGVLCKGPNGAPRPCGQWHYSLSHCRDWVAGVVHQAHVGIDVERIQERGGRLMERVLDSAEAKLLGVGATAFTRAWTAKEALLKRAGVGLAELSACKIVGLEDEERLWLVHRGERWLVRQKPVADHILSVHTLGYDWRVAWDQLPQEPTA